MHQAIFYSSAPPKLMNSTPMAGSGCSELQMCWQYLCAKTVFICQQSMKEWMHGADIKSIMYFKTTRAGGHAYLQIAGSYR